MSAVTQTNHGAELDSKPLNQRWRKTPVAIREDIAQHGERVKHALVGDLRGVDLLAQAMCFLSLETAGFGGFGGFGDQGKMVDKLVKMSVASHHRRWIMRPLEALYDEMTAGALCSVKSVDGEEGVRR